MNEYKYQKNNQKLGATAGNPTRRSRGEGYFVRAPPNAPKETAQNATRDRRRDVFDRTIGSPLRGQPRDRLPAPARNDAGTCTSLRRGVTRQMSHTPPPCRGPGEQPRGYQSRTSKRPWYANPAAIGSRYAGGERHRHAVDDGNFRTAVCARATGRPYTTCVTAERVLHGRSGREN